MFSLSFWDTISSVAIALSTLPVSKDVIGVYMFDEDNNNDSNNTIHDHLEAYNFNGVVLGNAGTCTAQGFAVTAGQAFAMLSNVTLSIYYVSSIRFKITDEEMRKKLLPVMVVISCVVGLPVCVTPLVMGLYNPQPFEPYCYIGPYPHLCNIKHRSNSTDRTDGTDGADSTDIFYANVEAGECIRGDVPAETEEIYDFVVTVAIGLCFITMVVSLVLVVISVFQTEMSVRRMMKREREQNAEEINESDVENDAILQTGAGTWNDPRDAGGDAEHGDTNMNTASPSPQRQRQGGRSTNTTTDFQETRTVLRFALMYIVSFFLTWIWTAIGITVPIAADDSIMVKTLEYGTLIPLQLQGFFNALIFIYDKVCFARKADSSLSFVQALKMVVVNPSAVPEALVSSLDVVDEDRREMEENRRVWELVDADLERNREHELELEREHELEREDASSLNFSNFASISTPSCVLSNAISSQGVDKEVEARMKRDGDPSETPRQFYVNTPKKYLEFHGDTRPAAWNLDRRNSGSTRIDIDVDTPSTSSLLLRDDNHLMQEEDYKIPPNPHSACIGTRTGTDTGTATSRVTTVRITPRDSRVSIGSGASSAFTSRSLLSGFSSPPSHLPSDAKSHISEEEQEQQQQK